MVAAVVFDMDGVIIDSEQVWDEVREAARRRLGRALLGRGAAGDDGHELARVVALHARRARAAQEPEEINDEVVRRMLERYRSDLPLLDGAVEAVRSLAASYPLAVASSSNRPLIDAVLETAGIAECFVGDRLVRGGGAREAQPGRLPGGGAAARRRAGAVRCGRGLRERHPGGEGGRDAS